MMNDIHPEYSYIPYIYIMCDRHIHTVDGCEIYPIIIPLVQDFATTHGLIVIVNNIHLFHIFIYIFIFPLSLYIYI